MTVNLRIVLSFTMLTAVAAQAQILSHFQHIIVVFQENRTPDNLFYALCSSNTCATTPDPCTGTSSSRAYNIQVSNWLNASSPTGVTQPVGVPINNGYDLAHSHAGFKNMCDGGTQPTKCKMDGAYRTAPNNGAYIYVLNTNGILTPYLNLATSYGWANCMFQTNQGPSYAAHQFIFGGTSALTATDDLNGIFVAENFTTNGVTAAPGCYAQDGETVKLAHPDSSETAFKINHAAGAVVCSKSQAEGGRDTLADKLEAAGFGWTYYSSIGPGQDHGGSIWTAPNTLYNICVPDSNFQNCTGTRWKNHVVLNPSQVLADMGANGGKCNLSNVSWVVPTGPNSDHPSKNTGGPAWVSTVINALGQSPCTDLIGGQTFSYWNDTAVVITWDDWGGFYDHEPPPILASPEGGYQLGFRVPMIFVSAYTPLKYIDNHTQDFGSILRFVEHNFSLGEGVLGFADARATNDLTSFYNLSRTPRAFLATPSSKSPIDFIYDTTPPEDVDDE